MRTTGYAISPVPRNTAVTLFLCIRSCTRLSPKSSPARTWSCWPVLIWSGRIHRAEGSGQWIEAGPEKAAGTAAGQAPALRHPFDREAIRHRPKEYETQCGRAWREVPAALSSAGRQDSEWAREDLRSDLRR